MTTTTGKHFSSKREMYRALGIQANTLNDWLARDWFPKKTRWGWNKKQVLDAVEKHNEAKLAKKGDGTRADKIRLECERLRISIAREKEFLKVAELETAEREGRLVAVADVEADLSRTFTNMRARIENWRAHETSKDPDLADRIDALVDGLIDLMGADL